MYAKLESGALRRAPNKVTHNNKIIFNPPEDVILKLGYFPVTYMDMPVDAPEGKHYESHWEQTETEIVQVWTLADDAVIPESELSAEEALDIIMGVVS